MASLYSFFVNSKSADDKNQVNTHETENNKEQTPKVLKVQVSHKPEITGFTYQDHFVTPAEATELLNQIDAQPWSCALQRRVQHYGYVYDYKNRNVAENMNLGPLPEWSNFIIDRLLEQKLISTRPNQIIVNEYMPGQGISAHIDQPRVFGPEIVSLSLGSDCIMTFANAKKQARVDHLLKKRSVVILKDEARYSWTHEIVARKSDLINGERVARNRRVSLTFRTFVLPTK